jgi:hypothetical protein
MTSAMRRLTLLVTLLPVVVSADTLLKDESTTLGPIRDIQCVGGGVACTRSGATGVFTIDTAAGGAPVDAEFITYAANAVCSAERVLSAGDGTSVDLATAGQAQVDCVPASGVAMGCVTTGVQTFAGAKTWTGAQTITAGSATDYALDINSTAVASNQEVIQRWRVSDDSTAFFQLFNHTVTDSVFDPAFKGRGSASTRADLQFIGEPTAANDTGTLPSVNIQGRRDTLVALSNRPVLGVYNLSTQLAVFGPTHNLGLSSSFGNTKFALWHSGASSAGIGVQSGDIRNYLDATSSKWSWRGTSGGSSVMELTGLGVLTLPATSGNTLNVESGGLVYDATNNRVGINDSTPSFSLDVTGTANVTGAVTFGSTLAVTGKASVTANSGTITLAAGTGTATVTSGARCICTDQTAVAAVQCSVSGTTLTANGTATDVITYLCDR